MSSRFSSGCFASSFTNARSLSNICVLCLYLSGDGGLPPFSTGSSSNLMTDPEPLGMGELGRDRLRGGGLSARPDSRLPLLAPPGDTGVAALEGGEGRGGAARRCAESRDRNIFASSGSSWFTTAETRVCRNVSALMGGPSSHISRNLDDGMSNVAGAIDLSTTHCCCLISYNALLMISSLSGLHAWTQLSMPGTCKRSHAPHDLELPEVIEPALCVCLMRRASICVVVRACRPSIKLRLLLDAQTSVSTVHVYGLRLGVVDGLMRIPGLRDRRIAVLARKDLQPLARQLGAVVSVYPVRRLGLEDGRRAGSRAGKTAQTMY